LHSKGDKITPYAAAILDKNKYWARRSYVALAIREPYLVTAYVTQQAYKEWLAQNHVVNCELWTCTCTRFQDMLLPCSYAIAAIFAAGADLMDWILLVYTIVGLVITYSHVQLYPVIVEDLDIDPSVKAPEKRKMRGKITKKRK
jgi:hypothetical protein